jgi:hypothetical protein
MSATFCWTGIMGCDKLGSPKGFGRGGLPRTDLLSMKSEYNSPLKLKSQIHDFKKLNVILN